MKTIVFLGSALLLLGGCRNDVQPANTSNAAASRATNSSTIVGTPQIARSMMDSTNCHPTGFVVTAIKLDIDKIVIKKVNTDSLSSGTPAIRTDTLWKETNTQLTTSSNVGQPFKITDVPSGYYKVLLETKGCALRSTLAKVKVSDNSETDLGVIRL